MAQQQGFTSPQPITGELPSDLPSQSSEHLNTEICPIGSDPLGNTPPDERPEITLDVRVAASSGDAAAEGSPSLGKEARHSASVASRRTNRSLPTNGVGEGGAVTTANEPPDVDPSLQAREVSVGEERKHKAIVGKEERAFPILFHFVHL